jgi:hypothetical protein
MMVRRASTSLNGRERLKRRTFLAAAGLGVAAPLAHKMASLAGAAPGPRVTRLLALYVPHGAPVEHFEPAGQGTDFSFAASGGVKIFEPWQAYRSKIVMLRGIQYKDHTNHVAIAAALTNGPRKSLLHVVAEGLQVQPITLGALPYPELAFGPENQLFHDGTDWVRPETNPVRAASALLPATDSGPVSGDADFRRRTLSLTIAEIEALRKQIAGLTSEDNKLAVHLEAVQALKEGGGALPTSGDCKTPGTLPALEAVTKESNNGVEASYFFQKANFPRIYEAQLEVAGQALLCGSARVIGIQALWANAQVNFGFMGVPKDHHDPISHSRNVTGREEFANCQRWFAEKVTETILRVLDQPDPLDSDPTRTVLDNTLIYWFSEIGDGNEHNSEKRRMWLYTGEIDIYLPLFVIGGAGGYLKTGQLLDFENRAHADLLMTLCAAMGVYTTDFGPNSGSLIEELRA